MTTADSRLSAVVAGPYDYGRCEACEKPIKKGQLIRRWADGVRTHEVCPQKSTSAVVENDK